MIFVVAVMNVMTICKAYNVYDIRILLLTIKLQLIIIIFNHGSYIFCKIKFQLISNSKYL